MTLRHLNVFITVCKHNNITRAAEELHVAQPAVSATIADIERHYNIVLFERINKRLVLTDVGKNLLIKARELMSGFEDFESLAFQTQHTMSVRIGAAVTIGKTVLPIILERLNREHPEIKFAVTIGQTLDLENKIADGTLDFALIEGKVSVKNIQSEAFWSDTLVAVAGWEYPIADSISLSELLTHPLLLREPGSAPREFADSLFTIHSMSFHPRVESLSNEALIAIAGKNLGVAILPQSIVAQHLGHTLKRIDLENILLERQYFLIYHKDKTFHSVHKAVRDACLHIREG